MSTIVQQAQVAAVIKYLLACGGRAEVSDVSVTVCCIGSDALLKLVRRRKVPGVTCDGSTLVLETQGG